MKYNTKCHRLTHRLFKCLKLEGNSDTRGIGQPLRGEGKGH